MAWWSSFTRRVMVPVCQCSRTRPVQSQNGYSVSGDSRRRLVGSLPDHGPVAQLLVAVEGERPGPGFTYGS